MIWTASNCSATLNGKSYTSGTWIEQEGEYTFVITNDANRSTTYKFTVDHYYARYSMVAPTCTQKGYTIYKCTGCGDSYNGDFIEAKGHDYESKIVKPTCTAQGYTRYTCKTCGNTYSDNFVEAEGHQYGEWTTVKEPTCVDLGKDERTCSVCSYVDERDSLLRVAAYCRVSTDSEDQLESYKAQVAYYTDAIAKNPRWRFVDIYADEGIIYGEQY